MARCKYKEEYFDMRWECFLDALPGEEYCYWHKEEDGKEPTEEQLEELSGKRVLGVYLQKAELSRADLREVELPLANLRGAELSYANLYGAKLSMADLQGAELSYANLYRAKLIMADLQGADLYGAKFDYKTDLDDSVLDGANLYHSYFDETKSFRNVSRVFRNDGDREINEIAGGVIDSWLIWIFENGDKYPIKIISKIISFVITKILNKKSYIHLPLKPSALNVVMIECEAPIVAAKLRREGLIRYVMRGEKIIFFDWHSGCTIKNPEDGQQHKGGPSSDCDEELMDILLKDGKIRSEFFYHGHYVKPPSHGSSVVYYVNRADLYEASYEVYNNLYNFYIANGKLDQAAHVHYRRGEAHRKLRWARGGLMNRARSIFDLLILRTLTGYGDRIGRPIFISGLIIGLFAALFWHFDGIVKNVNGTQVAPDWIDYLYHSITTFTSLGYSNIQPNLAAGHLPQILVAAESGLGVLMMALIIFVVTYQVSR